MKEKLKKLGVKSSLCESDDNMNFVHEGREVVICSTIDDVDKFSLKHITSVPQYKCDECGKKYTKKSILVTHMVRHRQKSELPFSCLSCKFHAATKVELARHSSKHQREYFNCPFCSKVYLRESSVTEHVKKSHVMNYILECAKCNFQTFKRNIMKNHILKHDGPLFCCPICGAFFEYKCNLQVHVRNHADIRTHVCKECGKGFLKSNDLSAHIKQVHKPKSYECSFCKKKFTTIHQLKRHFLTHTLEKPYSCCFCSYASTTHGNLLKHIRSVHRKFHFTYKDVLKIKGELKDPKDVLPTTKLKTIQDEGHKVVKDELNKLQSEKTSNFTTIADLQKKIQMKKMSREASIKAKKLRKERKSTLKKGKDNQPEDTKPLDSTQNTIYNTEKTLRHSIKVEEDSINVLERKITSNGSPCIDENHHLEYEVCDTAQNEGSNHMLPVFHVTSDKFDGQCIIQGIQEIPNPTLHFMRECTDSEFSKYDTPLIIVEKEDTVIEETPLYRVVGIDESNSPELDSSVEICKGSAPETSHCSQDSIIIQTITGKIDPPEESEPLTVSIKELFSEKFPNEVKILINEQDIST